MAGLAGSIRQAGRALPNDLDLDVALVVLADPNAGTRNYIQAQQPRAPHAYRQHAVDGGYVAADRALVDAGQHFVQPQKFKLADVIERPAHHVSERSLDGLVDRLPGDRRVLGFADLPQAVALRAHGENGGDALLARDARWAGDLGRAPVSAQFCRLAGCAPASLAALRGHGLAVGGHRRRALFANTDEVGVIAINGPNVFSGYLGPHHNEGVFIEIDGERWLNSGDLGRRDSKGYFWLAGRKKELIIRGGHNIDPKIIEDALQNSSGRLADGGRREP